MADAAASERRRKNAQRSVEQRRQRSGDIGGTSSIGEPLESPETFEPEAMADAAGGPGGAQSPPVPGVPRADWAARLNPEGKGLPRVDPETMKKLMADVPKGKDGLPDVEGMDMAAMQKVMAGMGIGAGTGAATRGLGGLASHEQAMKAEKSIKSQQEKNAGETEGEQNGHAFRWEQTSKFGESEVLIRFALTTPATKKDVKVVFRAGSLKVTVAGVDLLGGKTFGSTHPDDSTWCLVEKGSELQVQLALAEDVKWKSLLAEWSRPLSK